MLRRHGWRQGEEGRGKSSSTCLNPVAARRGMGMKSGNHEIISYFPFQIIFKLVEPTEVIAELCPHKGGKERKSYGWEMGILFRCVPYCCESPSCLSCLIPLLANKRIHRHPPLIINRILFSLSSPSLFLSLCSHSHLCPL